MSAEACREWRGDLALYACGRADPGSEAALQAHLDGCRVCRTELAALRGVVAALDLADLDRLDETVEAPPELPDRILRRVEAERRVARRRARRRVVAGAAVAAVLLVGAVGVLAALRDGGTRPLDIVFDDSPAGVQATAELVAKPWGTEVSLAVEGLDPRGVYWLWLTDASGRRMGAGTFSGIEGAARVVMASALPTESASRIWVTDADDHVILDEHLPTD